MIKSKREIAMNFSEARPASPPSRVSGARPCRDSGSSKKFIAISRSSSIIVTIRNNI